MNAATSTRTKVLTALLAGLAAGLSALLLYQSQVQDTLPGCGVASGCGVVLSSRWSQWFGMPVSLPAMGGYAAMLFAVVMRDPRATSKTQRTVSLVMVFTAVTAVIAAVWFISVQLFVVKALCKYCLATHATGVTASVLCLLAVWKLLPGKSIAWASGGALVLVSVLIGGQVLGPKPQAAAPLVQYAAEESQAAPQATSPKTTAPKTTAPQATSNSQSIDDPSPAPNSSTSDSSASSSSTSNPSAQSSSTVANADPSITQPAEKTPKPRGVLFYGGRLSIHIDQVPIIGSPDAEILLLCLYDYTCSHCRTTRRLLEGTKQKHGDTLAIIFLPTPLDAKCNRLIKRTQYQHRYACDVAKISLAVWRADPSKWAQFDRMLYNDVQLLTPVRSRFEALKLIDEKSLDRELSNPWPSEQLARDVELYRTAARAAGSSALPMLITKRGVMNGTPRHPLDLDNFIKGRPIRARN